MSTGGIIAVRESGPVGARNVETFILAQGAAFDLSGDIALNTTHRELTNGENPHNTVVDLSGVLQLAGVAGGQTANGGTESGDSLDLIGNTQGDGDINLNVTSFVSRFGVAFFAGGTDSEAAQVTISSGTLIIKATESHGRISTGGDHAWIFQNFGVGRHDFERLLTVTALTTISLQSGWVVADSSAETLSALAPGTYLVTGSSFNGAATGQIYVGLIA